MNSRWISIPLNISAYDIMKCSFAMQVNCCGYSRFSQCRESSFHEELYFLRLCFPTSFKVLHSIASRLLIMNDFIHSIIINPALHF